MEQAGNRPKVSVILSIYNMEPYLRQCLDSIMAQTLDDIEIICVDDASTDASLTILREYERRDDRFRIITQPHGDAGKARNTGLDLARGKYVSVLDSDDFFEPDMLRQAYLAAEEHQADIVVFRSDQFDHAASRFEPCDYSIRADMLPEGEVFSADDIPDRIFNIGCGWAWDKLFLRELIEKHQVRFQELRTTNDMYFVFCLYTKAQRIFFLDQLLIHRRIHAFPSLSVTREQSWENFYLALRALREQLIADQTYERFRRSFVNWALNFSLWQIDTLSPSVSRQLKERCREEYFDRLDITGHDRDYFYQRSEYERMTEILSDGIKVSVIIPVYNGSRWLRQCLDSVCAQTLREIQIICIDDASTDETPAILREFEQQDDRITVIRRYEHTNAGACRNAGLALAKGEYVSFLDADDFFEPQMLANVYEAARQNDAQICAFRCDMYHEDTGSFEGCPWTLKLHQMPAHRPFSCDDCADHIFTMTSCTAWDKLFKRDFIQRHGLSFQEINSCNDMRFTFSAYTRAQRIDTLDQLLVHKRIGHQRALSCGMDILWHNFFDALSALRQFLIDHDCYARFKKSFLNWAADFTLWNVRNYRNYYASLLRSSCRRRFFKELDLADAPKEIFENPGYYQEIHRILQEQARLDSSDIPVVSVIVPVYNAERYLEQCLNSLLSQTIEQIEIICVDDGSTDHSPDMLRRFSRTDNRVKVFFQTNAGAGCARNLGLSYARGRFIAFADSDDFFEPDMLECCTETAEHDDSDIVVFAANKFDDSKQQFIPKKLGLTRDYYPDHSPFSPQEMPDGMFMAFQNWPWNKLFRHTLIKEKGLTFQNVTRSNDVAFVITAIALAGKISVIDHIFAHYRVNTGSSLQQTRYQAPLGFFDSYREAARRLKAAGVYPVFERSFLNKLFSTVCHNLRTIQSPAARLAIIHFLKFSGNNEFGFTQHDSHYYLQQKDVSDYLRYIGGNIRFEPVLLSVIIPVYNAEQYIGQTLESILTQSLERIEIICVDDGSTDSTREIIRRYAKRDSRIRLICQQNQHAGIARNTGLQAASGEYVHFMDADDLVLEYAYESVQEIAGKYRPDCLKFCAVAFDETNHITIENRLYSLSFVEDGQFLTVLAPDDPVILELCRTPWTGIYRREFLLANHILFNDLYCVNDRSFFAHVITKAQRIMLSRDRVVLHRVNMPGSLVGRRALHFDCQMASIRIIEQQLRHDGIGGEAAEAIMRCELNDLMAWCSKFASDETLGETILSDTEEFLAQLKYPFMGNYLQAARKIRLTAAERKSQDSPPSATTLVSKAEPVRLFCARSDHPVISLFLKIPDNDRELGNMLHLIAGIRYDKAEFLLLNTQPDQNFPAVVREFAFVDQRIVPVSLQPGIEITEQLLNLAAGTHLMCVRPGRIREIGSLAALADYLNKSTSQTLRSDPFLVMRRFYAENEGRPELSAELSAALS